MTAADNVGEPIHRWFRFKEAYSHRLLSHLVAQAGGHSGELRLFDPFAGSGTTMLSAIELGRRTGSRVTALGVERNPVMRVVASAKVGAALSPREAARAVEMWLPEVASTFAALVQGKRLVTGSPTLNNARYFDPLDVQRLLALGRAVRSVGDPLARSVLSTCLAAAVEPAGRIRKDGRALRYVPEKSLVSPWEGFEAAVAQVREDLALAPVGDCGSAHVRSGDARDGQLWPDAVDWVVFSPPYPNNIDYTEVYKVEAWVLGLFSDSRDLRQQRLATLRSHPSILFPDEYRHSSGAMSVELADLAAPLLAAVPSDRYKRGRMQVIRGYLDDMFGVMLATRSSLVSGGRAAVVVGNSSHGRADGHFVFAADLLLARLGELAGLAVEGIQVARRPARRPDLGGWLRESVVLFRG